MDRLTREEICSAEFRARIIGYGIHGAAPRLEVWQAEQLCDLALRALSQEAVPDEVLEEAARACEADLIYFSEGFANGCRECAKAIRALKREPNAAPMVGQFAHYDASDPDRPAMPAAPVAEMVMVPRELTPAMHEAGLRFAGTLHENYEDCWKVLLSAAEAEVRKG